MAGKVALTVLVVVLMGTVPATARAAGTGFDDEGYLRTADRFAARLAPAWSPADGYYVSGSPALDSRLNAAMLVVYATAARYGHAGPSRDANSRVESLVG